MIFYGFVEKKNNRKSIISTARKYRVCRQSTILSELSHHESLHILESK